ncbi:MULTISPECIES: DNA polymerase Y family protein [Rhodopseudomonas]|uniref:DNA-directed DNA polymerase n=1 Tax=Rhodopseudomonas palustris TaxID=1076 RepID=A0A0D7ESI9_RHOPL|nr:MULTISPECIES: DNA polymerase Y family protein [Rhodopseudomonas]KIZ43641.1 DNA polymerase [Rhodopseudomonas palustris]MDF3813049.1 DNA polymerase Y family protein [Rhodopseudomonas sp. BAL398]WOK20054.1 DNA polymerase Y family protein [Rhodopseudomonas sp. BAL398]
MSAFSVTRRRILSLWLPRLPTDRLRRLQSHGNAAPVSAASPPWIVVAKHNNALQVVALDHAASVIGLAIGVPLANARAICPELQVFDADDSADARTRDHIADWCDRFTPLVALDGPDGLLLDITGCAHLFGGEAALLRMLCTALTAQGFAVSAAIASTSVCARTLSRARHGHIVPDGDEAMAVAPLPVAALGVDAAIVGGLRRAGLKSIGDVASRARHEITARFGAAFTARLEQALGQSEAPISPRQPLPDYIVEKRFAEPIATDGVIVATLSGLAQMLVAAMDRQGKGARRLQASFFRTDGAVRTIAVDTGQPVTKAAMIDRLFAERLAAIADPLDPGFGFDLIRLSASRTEIVVQQQSDLDAHVHDNDELAALLDRLAARLGPRRVVVHLPQDTHIPERAALALSAQRHLTAAAQAVWPARIADEPPLRPLRLFEHPEPIQVIAGVPDGPPAQFRWRRAHHAVVRAEGPERVAMEWWRADGAALTRDYFRVEDETGLRFWLYRDGLYGREVEASAGQPNWFMHGLFA